MICNERQYKITSKQLEELKSALISLNGGEASDWLVNAQKAALESQISDLESPDIVHCVDVGEAELD